MSAYDNIVLRRPEPAGRTENFAQGAETFVAPGLPRSYYAGIDPVVAAAQYARSRSYWDRETEKPLRASAAYDESQRPRASRRVRPTA